MTLELSTGLQCNQRRRSIGFEMEAQICPVCLGEEGGEHWAGRCVVVTWDAWNEDAVFIIRLYVGLLLVCTLLVWEVN